MVNILTMSKCCEYATAEQVLSASGFFWSVKEIFLEWVTNFSLKVLNAGPTKYTKHNLLTKWSLLLGAVRENTPQQNFNSISEGDGPRWDIYWDFQVWVKVGVPKQGGLCEYHVSEETAGWKIWDKDFKESLGCKLLFDAFYSKMDQSFNSWCEQQSVLQLFLLGKSLVE